LSTGVSKNPVLLGGIVVAFTVALGLGAFGLNQVVNPPPAQPSPSVAAALPTPGAQPVAACPAAPASHLPMANPTRTFAGPPPMSLDLTKGYCAYMDTSKGMIAIRLRADAAPLTVNNFVFLAKGGFYDGLGFHRVCPSAADSSCGGGGLFIAQGGDPKGDGTGGPGYKFADEPVKGDYVAGSLAMANSGPNTNGSQFFINTGDNSSLPHNYNLFGQITAGVDAAKSLVKGDKMLWVDIETTPLPAASPAAAAGSPAPSPS